MQDRYFDKAVFKANIGDYIMRKKELAQVRGYAYGKDGRPCYAVEFGPECDQAWRTYLIPCETVEYKLEKVVL